VQYEKVVVTSKAKYLRETDREKVLRRKGYISI